MATTPTHTRLLAQAGREILRPLGLTQRGRSRTWIDDHGWCLCLVEFQPSSWSRGSYLNVGAMWLWHDEVDDLYFAVGHRVDEAPYVEFESESQFAPAARNFAQVAAREVQRYRELFADLGSTAAYLDARQDGTNPHHDALDAGIAWSLIGETKRAKRAFDRADTIIERHWKDWADAAGSRSDEERARARELGIFLPDPAEGPSFRAGLDDDHARVEHFRSLLAHPAAYRAEIARSIASVRRQLKLSEIETPL